MPSMMPRPILTEWFNLSYRKIPVLLINKDLYIDTSLIFEILHAHPAFPPSDSHPPLHTNARNRTLTRLLSSHYTDRPLFRLTTGLIPQAVWETGFGKDRSNLIGHQLDAAKLGAKVPLNLSALDTHLSILEPLFAGSTSPDGSGSGGCRWILGTETPSGADIAFYYQLAWGEKISRGQGIHDLTGGATTDGRDGDNGMHLVFNRERYPNLVDWFHGMERYMGALPDVETRIDQTDTRGVDALMQQLNETHANDAVDLVMSTGRVNPHDLNNRLGLTAGSRVSIAPDDTGRSSPTVGVLLGLSTEEVVIEPDAVDGKKPTVQGIRAHFPKVGFVVKPVPVVADGSSGHDAQTQAQKQTQKPGSKL